MGPTGNSPWDGALANEAFRCFVTAVVVDKPEYNRFVGTVHFKQDHGGPVGEKGGVTGSFNTATAQNYRIGDVVNVALS